MSTSNSSEYIRVDCFNRFRFNNNLFYVL